MLDHAACLKCFLEHNKVEIKKIYEKVRADTKSAVYQQMDLVPTYSWALDVVPTYGWVT